MKITNCLIHVSFNVSFRQGKDDTPAPKRIFTSRPQRTTSRLLSTPTPKTAMRITNPFIPTGDVQRTTTSNRATVSVNPIASYIEKYTEPSKTIPPLLFPLASTGKPQYYSSNTFLNKLELLLRRKEATNSKNFQNIFV